MTTYSRFGCEVEVIAGSMASGLVDIRFVDDGAVRQAYPILDLQATDGLAEVEAALDAEDKRTEEED